MSDIDWDTVSMLSPNVLQRKTKLKRIKTWW